MNPVVAQSLKDLLLGWGLKSNYIPSVSYAIALAIILIAALIADFIAKRIIVSVIHVYVKKSKNTWDDVFLEKKVFHRLAHIAPAAVIYYTIHLVFYQSPGSIALIQTLVSIFIIIVSLLVVYSFIDALHEIYNTFPISKERTIKGYVQVVKIIFGIITAILILSILLNKPAGSLLAGLGAMAAVLMLVFKDTILGLVASIQLSANDMLKIGDWIEMPKFNIDGSVLEISLTTAKIQNWDKTIITLPTYTLVSDSFINWRGMQLAGARRVKRTFFIDINTIKLIDKERLDLLAKHPITSTYIATLNLSEITDKHSNLGVFRNYVNWYLFNNIEVVNNQTLLVRHQQPVERGIPMELVYFTKNTDGKGYEATQSTITEHVITATSLFGLKIFQIPSGEDVKFPDRLAVKQE